MSTNNLAPSNSVEFVGAMHPLKTQLTTMTCPQGLTIIQMLDRANVDPWIMRDAVIFVDDWEIPKDKWHVTKPRAGRRVTARILAVPRGGGGGGGGKNPLRTVLMLAVLIAAPYAGAYLAGAAGFTAGTTAFTVASGIGTALVSTAGMLLVNMIAPVKPPKMPSLSGTGGGVKESPSLFVEGSRNNLRPFDVIPSVLGYYRFAPPKAAKTYTEVLGDNNILRDLFVVGFGELELSDWRIGDDPITNFSDYELEVRTGTDADTDVTIYPGVVDQNEFSIKLTYDASWQTRTTAVNADEISVDLSFPRGLLVYDDQGGRGSASVSIDLEWREVGSVTWLPLPATVDATFDTANISGSTITFTAARSVALRHGVRWKTGARGQYEVQIRRTTTDTTSDRVYDELFWATLRTFTNTDPIIPPVPLAKAALQIRSTDQLNGVIDELTVLAKSVCLDWDSGTSTWVERATNNPASLYRHVLQGPAKAVPYADSLIDLEKLQEWHEFCVTKGFTFNKVYDYETSIYDVLSDIASAGRAGVDFANGKWTVVIDQPQTNTVTLINSRNSWGFEGEKSFLDVPHAWRIRFPNENTDYRQDERVVYQDGYTSANATLFESIEFAGVTNPDQIWKQGRFYGALITQRPERWSVMMDYEFLIPERGSKVELSHDVMLIGQGSGRIKSMELDGSSNVISITLDEEFTMVAGTSYGLVVRRDVTGDVSLSIPLTTVEGSSKTVIPSTPVAAVSAPEVGDLASFGEFGEETEDALILNIEPGNEFTAKVTMVPYRAVVYDSDAGTVPTYVPTISDTALIPTVIIDDVVTDESVLARGAGDTVLTRAEVRVNAPQDSSLYLEVQQRVTGTGETWYDSAFDRRNQIIAVVSDVQQGETYDFRVRWNDGSRIPGAWAVHPNVRIVGKSTPPSALVGMTINSYGGQAYIRWDGPGELDVRFGGRVEFRHSQSFADPGWEESVSIGDSAQARQLFTTLPLKSGTYLARVYDADNNPSDTITSVNTKQASVLAYANVDTIDEAPSWLGTHDGTVVKGSELEMQGVGQFDDIPDLDAIVNLDYYGGVVATATYTFAAGFDFTTVTRVRLTTRITSLIENVLDSIDSRTELMDTWEDFDGTTASAADVKVYERHTDDDPAGTPTWSEWNRLDSAEFETRGVEFKAVLTSSDPSYDIHLSELGVDAEQIV